MHVHRVSTTSGSTGNLLEFNCFSWKFFNNISMIDDWHSVICRHPDAGKPHRFYHAMLCTNAACRSGVFRGGRTAPPVNSANISMKVWNLVSWLSGKIIKIVATRCQILRLKCAKCNFGWGSTPDPAGGAYSTPPDPLAGLRGLLLRVGEGMGRGR